MAIPLISSPKIIAVPRTAQECSLTRPMESDDTAYWMFLVLELFRQGLALDFPFSHLKHQLRQIHLSMFHRSLQTELRKRPSTQLESTWRRSSAMSSMRYSMGFLVISEDKAWVCFWVP